MSPVPSRSKLRALITAQVGEAGLFGLVNNAGIAVGAPMEFMPMEDLRWQFDVNFFGQVAVTQAFVELLRAGKGRIINISSIGGRVTAPILGAYSASKFALEAITTAFRLELSVWGIDAIAIEPGALKPPSGTVAQALLTASLPSSLHAPMSFTGDSWRQASAIS
jgi:NAD(P)-dependent dehydrogenase (short-subunit alcohol dehydrogenase family)